MGLNLLIKSKKLVFRVTDIAKILGIENKNYLLVYINRMKKRNELIMIKKGIYALSSDYNPLELANKIKIPSYVSLQTILFKNGITFQDFSNIITSCSNNSISFKLNNKTYHFHKIKDEILTNPLGIIVENQARMASSERAICDVFYIYGDFHFDNLGSVDKQFLLSLSKIYNHQVIDKVKKICSIK